MSWNNDLDPSYVNILEKITALCKGFLMVINESRDKAQSFCRGLFLLLKQLFSMLPGPNTS